MGDRELALAGVLVLAALSGCAAYPFVGPSCGPGGTDIGSIGGNVTGVELKGEVTHVNRTVLTIDDGTGEAAILLLEAGVADQVAAGDCIIARDATAVPAEDRSADVVVLAGELLKEEVVIEEERP